MRRNFQIIKLFVQKENGKKIPLTEIALKFNVAPSSIPCPPLFVDNLLKWSDGINTEEFFVDIFSNLDPVQDLEKE